MNIKKKSKMRIKLSRSFKSVDEVTRWHSIAHFARARFNLPLDQVNEALKRHKLPTFEVTTPMHEENMSDD